MRRRPIIRRRRPLVDSLGPAPNQEVFSPPRPLSRPATFGGDLLRNWALGQIKIIDDYFAGKEERGEDSEMLKGIDEYLAKTIGEEATLLSKNERESA